MRGFNDKPRVIQTRILIVLGKVVWTSKDSTILIIALKWKISHCGSLFLTALLQTHLPQHQSGRIPGKRYKEKMVVNIPFGKYDWKAAVQIEWKNEKAIQKKHLVCKCCIMTASIFKYSRYKAFPGFELFSFSKKTPSRRY